MKYLKEYSIIGGSHRREAKHDETKIYIKFFSEVWPVQTNQSTSFRI